MVLDGVLSVLRQIVSHKKSSSKDLLLNFLCGLCAAKATSVVLSRRNAVDLKTRSACIDAPRGIGTQRGQGMAEYIIIVVIVAILVLVGVKIFGKSVGTQFENATQEVATLNSGEGGDKGGGAKGSGEGTSTTPSGSRTEADNREAAKSAGPVEATGAGKDDLARLRSESVGDREVPLAAQIKIDWRILAFIGGIVCAAGLYVVFQNSDWKKKRAKQDKSKKKKNLFSRDSKGKGQAMVEFVFVSITFLFTILGVLQLAMCLNAYSLVRYAAYNAARAAIVHGCDQEKMNEAARLSLVATFPKHGRADHVRGFMDNYLAARATDQRALFTVFEGPITEVKVINGGIPEDVTTFDDPVDSDQSIITVQVVHNYELVIPLVNRILYYVYTLWRLGVGYGGESLDYLSARTDALRRTPVLGGIEYRIPIVAHYTMRLQSDYLREEETS